MKVEYSINQSETLRPGSWFKFNGGLVRNRIYYVVSENKVENTIDVVWFSNTKEDWEIVCMGTSTVQKHHLPSPVTPVSGRVTIEF
jgi:hypothetical protein